MGVSGKHSRTPSRKGILLSHFKRQKCCFPPLFSVRHIKQVYCVSVVPLLSENKWNLH